VLLTQTIPYEELIENTKEKQIEKYDDLIVRLQATGNYRKLRRLRGKRANVSLNHDKHLARQVAEFTDGHYIAIENTDFR